MNTVVKSIEQQPKSRTLIKEAVRQNPIHKKAGLMEQLFTYWFNGLVYNQIWEDPRVDMNALEMSSDSRVVTIGSGGCNALSYLTRSPKEVHVVDLNPCHMYLTRLKIAALKTLPSYQDFFQFFAVAKDKKNVQNYYDYVRENLDDAARSFWDGGTRLRRTVLGPRINYFAKNFYRYSRSGYFIRFLHAFSRFINIDLTKILEAKSMDEQKDIYRRWIAPAYDHWLARFLGQIPWTVFSLGIPPQQFEELKQSDPGGIISVFRERTRRLACDYPIDENWFAWQAFGMKYNTENSKSLPYYLREDWYELLRERVPSISTYIGSVTDYLRQKAEDSLDCFVLLDSQDWMTKEQLDELWGEISRVGSRGARVIFRTAGAESPIEKLLDEELRSKFVYEEAQSRDFYAQDRSAVYGGFHLYRLAA